MKRLSLLIVTILLLTTITAAQEVEIDGYVNDYANILTPEEEQSLESILKPLHDTNIAEFAIVTIPSLEGQDIESYSLNLAQGVLGDKEKNNGLLLLISLEDKKYRFEVGRGLEYILNDAKVGRIGRFYLSPHFKEGNYALGINGATLAIDATLREKLESEYYVTKPKYNTEQAELIANLILFSFFMLFFVIIPLIFRKKKKEDRYFNAAMGALWLFGGRRGGNIGGFSGGGFSGFGGGGFGGGGSGGSW